MGKALLVVILFALVVYGALRLLELRRARRKRGSAPVRPAPPRRPIAPDDDPSFLRDLEQRRRREQHERDKGGDKAKPDDESEAS